MSDTFYQMARKIKRYGWRRSLPDHRDVKFSPAISLLSLPALVDLRATCPGIYDQLDLGSCTAQGLAALFEYLARKQGLKAYTPSRLFIYYNERVLEGTVNDDAGAEIRDGIKVLATLGAPHESLWWYNIAKFAAKPNKKVYEDGATHKISNYFAIDNTNLNDMRACLAEGFPIVGGFSVYESFESNEVARTGIVPLPKMSERLLGGHAILIVGYNDAQQVFIVRNSWGKNWGMKGYFTMPYAYFTNPNLAADFWTAKFVS